MNEEQKRSRDVLNDLLECNQGLTAREIEFCDSMDGMRGFNWSEPQIKWLDDIYERVC